MRQLGRPNLLAASYSGNAAAAATAAIEEVEDTLVGMLEELNRIGTGTGELAVGELAAEAFCLLPVFLCLPVFAHLAQRRAGPLLTCCARCACCAAGREGGVKPDWSHIFISVLCTLPLHSAR